MFYVPEAVEEYGKRAPRNVPNLLGGDTVDVEVSVVADGGVIGHLWTSRRPRRRPGVA